MKILEELQQFGDEKPTQADLRAICLDLSIDYEKTLKEIRQFMDEKLTLADLRAICLDLSIDYENLSGDTKSTKNISLIQYLTHRDQVGILVNWLRRKLSVQFGNKIYLPPPFQAPPLDSSFVGRKKPLSDLNKEVQTNNDLAIVGLVGYGGVGKSATATEFIHQINGRFPDGIFWIQLDISSPEAELTSIAAAFGRVDDIAARPDLPNKAEFVREILYDKECLLVIDQVENLDEVQWFIPHGKKNAMLVTTRNRLILSSINNATSIRLPAFSVEESLTYLKQTVGKERIESQIETVYKLVELVGRLPLALSLVAGFLKEASTLSISEYISYLQDENSLLANLSDWLTDRDIEKTFELSYQRLPPQLKNIFNLLAIFKGHNFSETAVAEIAGIPLVAAKLGLSRLSSLSLLTDAKDEFSTNTLTTGRFQLNSLLRAYAQQKLGSGIDKIRAVSINYYAKLAAEHHLPEDYALLDQEWPNISKLLFDSIDQSVIQDKLPQIVLNLTHNHMGIMGFLDIRGHWSDARKLLELAFEIESERYSVNIGKSDPLNQIALSAILINLGGFSLRRIDTTAVDQYLSQAQSILEQMSPTPSTLLQQAYLSDFMSQKLIQSNPHEAINWLENGIQGLAGIGTKQANLELGHLHISLSSLLARQGRFEESKKAVNDGLVSLSGTASSAQIRGYINLAGIAHFSADYSASRKYINQGLESAQQIKNVRLLAKLKQNLGTLEELDDLFHEAVSLYQEALELYQFMGDGSQIGVAHVNLGSVYTKLGNHEKAIAHLEQAYEIAKDRGSLASEAYAIINMAIEMMYHQPDEIQLYVARANEICNELNLVHLKPVVLRLQAQIDLRQTNLESSLDFISESIQIASTQKDPVEEGISWRVKGDILASMKDGVASLKAYDTSIALLSDRGQYEKTRSQVALAGFLLKKGLEATTCFPQTILEKALNTFEQIGAEREKCLAKALYDKYFPVS